MPADVVLLVVVGASVALAFWTVLRFPDFGPQSLGWAVIAFAVGACAPNLGLYALPLLAPGGVGYTLLVDVLPVFFVMSLTSFWLIRACVRPIGPRSGHPVRRHTVRPHS